ncbi:HEAT repeat domain-containing protein [Microcoleus sp. S28C3]|uniref:HEAT repeat domain-containing protein n=1 Tax=Microcoleus sp. S28C3 TaxID=3055414 RepID=UPI002FCE7E4C
MAIATFNPNDSELLKKIVECMGDSQGMVRLSLAETLGSIGKPATPFLLEALAHHPNPVVRRAFAKTLTLICGEAIARTTLLEAFLQDEDRVGGGRVGLKTKPAVSNRAYTDKTHLAWVKEFLLDRALTLSSQNERISKTSLENFYSLGS